MASIDKTLHCCIEQELVRMRVASRKSRYALGDSASSIGGANGGIRSSINGWRQRATRGAF